MHCLVELCDKLHLPTWRTKPRRPHSDGIASTMSSPWKLDIPLVLLALLLSACAQVGYIKPGMTEEETAQDLTECSEIARRQAFRDAAIQDLQSDALFLRGHRRDQLLPRHPGHNPGGLQHRYRQVCMLARGYEIAPLGDRAEE